MTSSREYPERPIVGVGGVVIENGRALLIRRGSEPLRGEWSIPGGTLELGESLQEGVARELSEETGLDVRVLELIEVFDRIFFGRKREDYRAGAPSPLSFRHRRLFVRAHWRGSSRWERCDRRGFCQRRRACAVPTNRNRDSRAEKGLCHGSCSEVWCADPRGNLPTAWSRGHSLSIPYQGAFAISMLPFELVSCNWQPP